MILHSDRLTLRPRDLPDYPVFRDFWMSDRASHIGGPMQHDFEVWRQFTAERGHWALRGFGLWTLVGAVIGVVGINTGHLFPETELGWMLHHGHLGHGYATEAAGALRDWAFGTRGLATQVNYVDPGNLASVAVAGRLGARLDPQAARQVDSAADLVFRHTRGTP